MSKLSFVHALARLFWEARRRGGSLDEPELQERLPQWALLALANRLVDYAEGESWTALEHAARSGERWACHRLHFVRIGIK